MTVVTNPARGPCASEERATGAGGDRVGGGGGAAGPAESPDPARPALFNSERDRDVVFVAGINDDTWRFPAHRRVLADASPVLGALLAAKADVIVVDYVDRRGFEQLLRHLYGEPVQLSAVPTARCALDSAYKFMCPELAERCARSLDELLDASVALEVLRDLRFLCARLPGAASAPPLPALADDWAASVIAACTHWCDALAHNALLVLDACADRALADERLEELPYEDLALIVKRDTLRVSSELRLAEALCRWSVAACKRSKQELTAANRRTALGELAYCPRYLLLAGAELERALQLELLDLAERELVATRARLAPAAPAAPTLTGEQEAMLRRFALARPAEPAAAPVHLSARSAPPPTPPPTPDVLCGRARRRRRKKKERTSERKEKQGCCACFGDGLLRAFICLFD